MEFVSHTLWGMTIVRNWSYLPAVFVFSNGPDILGAVPFWVHSTRKHFLAFKEKKIGLKGYLESMAGSIIPTAFEIGLYRSTHNLFIWLFVSLILYVFFREHLILSLAWLSHLLVDMPTHSREWATRLFYPISDFHFRGIDWTHSNKIVALNFMALLIINLLIYRFIGGF